MTDQTKTATPTTPAKESASTAARRRLAAIPHLQVGPTVKRHDIGDSLARKYGVWVAPVACGRDDLPTTLSTKGRERTRCPECLAATEPTE